MPKKPVMLLFHGGGFAFGEPEMPQARKMARRKGFKPVEVDYRLGNLQGAMRDASRAAKSYGPKRRVVAYGESAGATLAARLAQKGQVERAAAHMPVTKMNNVQHERLREIFDSLGATRKQMRRASPAAHRTRSPILAQIARDDILIDPEQTRAWARKDPRVKAQMVAGTHVFGVTPTQRRRQLRSAMGYLKRGTQPARRVRKVRRK